MQDRRSIMEQKFPHLFSPIEVGGKRLRNRIIMSPHDAPNAIVAACNGYDNASVHLANYMGIIARGGAAIVNTGHYGVDPRFRLGGETLAFDLYSKYEVHRHQIPTLHLCTDLVHSYGALASFELNHGGRYSTPFEGNKVYGAPWVRFLMMAGLLLQWTKLKWIVSWKCTSMLRRLPSAPALT